MKKLLFLSLVLFIGSWGSCHFGSRPLLRVKQATPGVAGHAPRAETFTFEEDGDVTPAEGLGAFMFFVALCIPLMLIIAKVSEKVEERRTKQ